MEPISVKDIMLYEPFTIKPTQSVTEAAALMKNINCGILPVGEPDNTLGIISDRDITLRVTAEGKDPANTPVKEVMTKILRTCDERTPIEEAAQLMRRHGVCRLVVTRGKRATGIVTLKHLLQNIGDSKASSQILHVLLAPQTAHIKMRGRSHG